MLFTELRTARLSSAFRAIENIVSPFDTVYFPTPNSGRDTAGLGDAAVVSVDCAGDELASGCVGADGGGASAGAITGSVVVSTGVGEAVSSTGVSCPSTADSSICSGPIGKRADETRAGSA